MSAESSRVPATAAFRFVVNIGGQPVAAFTECTLPVIEWDTEEIKEGGLNTFVHLRPGQRRAARITLKNGVGKSDLLDWYFQMMGETFERKSVTVTLLNSKKEPVMAWHIADAFPVRWTGPQLRSDDNTIAIQTLELACGEIEVVPSGA